MGFSRQEYWSGLPFPSPGDLPKQNNFMRGEKKPTFSFESESVSHSVISSSLQLHGLYPTRLLCQWDSPGKNTGAGSHALLQGIFPTQGSNLGLLHCRQILYCLSHQGRPLLFFIYNWLNKWPKKKKHFQRKIGPLLSRELVQLLSHVWLFVTPWTRL